MIQQLHQDKAKGDSWLGLARQSVLINRMNLNKMIAEWNLFPGPLWKKGLDEGKHRNKTLKNQRESELLCTQK